MAYTASTPRIGIVDLTSVATTLGTPGISQLPSVTLEPQLGEIATGWDPNLGGGEFMYVKAAANIVTAVAISGITISGTTATVTSAAHSLVPGLSVTLSGAVPAGYNGTVTVLTVPSGTTFTYTIPSGNVVPTIATTTQPTYVVGIGAGQVCELAYSLSAGYLTITATPWTGTAVSGKPLIVAVNNMAPNTYSWGQVQGAAITVVQGTITVGNPVYWQANGTVSNTVVASKQMVNSTASSLISSTIGQGSTAVVLPAIMAIVFLDRPFSQSAIT